MGLLIAAACCVDSGRNLWSPDDTRYEGYNFLKNPNFGEVMSLSKFNKIRAYFTYYFADYEKNGIDPWWYILEGLRNFNHSRKILLRYSPTLVVDKSMMSQCGYQKLCRVEVYQTSRTSHVNRNHLGLNLRSLQMLRLDVSFLLKFKEERKR